MASPARFWCDFNAAQCQDLSAVTAVVPLAATEQHGPHLPLGTDSEIMTGMLARVVGLAQDNLNFRITPTLTIGSSAEHLNVPGTLSLAPTLLLQAVEQIGDCLCQAGIRRMVLITSHGGNEEVISLAARALRTRHRALVVKTSWQRFGYPGNIFSAEEQKLGVHGGDYETSLMLYFRPDLVDMRQAANFSSLTEKMRDKFDLLSPQSPHGFAWQATDLNPAGVVGQADLSTAAKGAQTADHQARGLIKLLEELQRADPDDVLGS
jgi:creatinine amidohydrolase